MKTFSRCSLFFVTALFVITVVAADHGSAPNVPPEEALKKLIEGNERFIAGTLTHPHETLERAKETAIHGQHPFVTILSCSDSRVPLNIIFDQGIGDIFAIRVAGNVVGNHELGSIEYGVAHAGTRLCVVLGHTKCGAVTAASTGGGDEGNIKSLMHAIHPAVRRAEAETGKTGTEVVDSCTVHNVWYQIEVLCQRSAILREAVRSGQLLIVGAIDDIESGKVEFLGPHPKMEELIDEAKVMYFPPLVEESTAETSVEVHVSHRKIENATEETRSVERQRPVRRPLSRILFNGTVQPWQ